MRMNIRLRIYEMRVENCIYDDSYMKVKNKYKDYSSIIYI